MCGAAAKTAITQLVEDVEKFPGHIACDGDSQSEIVVPIVKDGKVINLPLSLAKPDRRPRFLKVN